MAVPFRKNQIKKVWRAPRGPALEDADIQRLEDILKKAQKIRSKLGSKTASKYLRQVRLHSEEIAPGHSGVALSLVLYQAEKKFGKMK